MLQRIIESAVDLVDATLRRARRARRRRAPGCRSSSPSGIDDETHARDRRTCPRGTASSGCSSSTPSRCACRTSPSTPTARVPAEPPADAVVPRGADPSCATRCSGTSTSPTRRRPRCSPTSTRSSSSGSRRRPAWRSRTPDCTPGCRSSRSSRTGSGSPATSTTRSSSGSSPPACRCRARLGSCDATRPTPSTASRPPSTTSTLTVKHIRTAIFGLERARSHRRGRCATGCCRWRARRPARSGSSRACCSTARSTRGVDDDVGVRAPGRRSARR